MTFCDVQRPIIDENRWSTFNIQRQHSNNLSVTFLFFLATADKILHKLFEFQPASRRSLADRSWSSLKNRWQSKWKRRGAVFLQNNFQDQGPYSQLGLRLNLDFGLQDFPLKNHKKTALKLL